MNIITRLTYDAKNAVRKQEHVSTLPASTDEVPQKTKQTLKQKLGRAFRATTSWTSGTISSGIILGILFFIIVNFYVFSSIVNLNSFFYAFLLLSLLTDGIFLLVHLPRKRKMSTRNVSLDPSKLTIVIASYNGADVIEATIRDANVHVPLKQIIVISDASTDATAEVAGKTGARVIVNEKNLHKVGSINAALRHVLTPYVLIVDDDTLIGGTKLPTSLLDEGYTAVAFNVMPVKHKTLINELQRFEYRSSMQVGKHLRGTSGAIGNVSGAIGLYRTSDLRKQIKMHSGQFAGEDEQRTLLAHLYGEGKGITYTDSLVLTQAPDTYESLFRQRAFSWSMSTPELFVLYWRVLLSSKFHYLLKAEKAYLVYIYLTDPLRILFCWTLFLHPAHLILAYGFYTVLNILIWARLGFKDTFRSVLFMPIYSLGLTLARFIGNFYWFLEKSRYLFRRLHRKASERHLIMEYVSIFVVIAASWFISATHFRSEMNIFQNIRSQRLTSNDSAFSYSSAPVLSSTAAYSAPADASYVVVAIEQGDTSRALAHKAIESLVTTQPSITLSDDQLAIAEEQLSANMPIVTSSNINTVFQVDKAVITAAISAAQGSQL